MNMPIVLLIALNLVAFFMQLSTGKTFIKRHFYQLHGYTVHQTMLKTFSLPTDAHNVKKHRVIKTF